MSGYFKRMAQIARHGPVALSTRRGGFQLPRPAATGTANTVPLDQASEGEAVPGPPVKDTETPKNSGSAENEDMQISASPTELLLRPTASGKFSPESRASEPTGSLPVPPILPEAQPPLAVSPQPTVDAETANTEPPELGPSPDAPSSSESPLPVPPRGNSQPARPPMPLRTSTNSTGQAETSKPEANRPIVPNLETESPPARPRPLPAMSPWQAPSTPALADGSNPHNLSRPMPPETIRPVLPTPAPPQTVEVNIGAVSVDFAAEPAPQAPAPRPAPARPSNGIWSGSRDLARNYVRRG